MSRTTYCSLFFGPGHVLQVYVVNFLDTVPVFSNDVNKTGWQTGGDDQVFGVGADRRGLE